jgi:hypothetical protein
LIGPRGKETCASSTLSPPAASAPALGSDDELRETPNWLEGTSELEDLGAKKK